MVARNDIVWADLGERGGRRPVCVLTRDAAIGVLSAITCAPVTTTVRGTPTEVEVNRAEGLRETSAIACDAVTTVPLECFDTEPIGRLGPAKRVELDRALRHALDIVF